MLKNNTIKEVFTRLSGKYFVKRNIDKYGYGEGVAYFLYNNPNELLYKEELKIQYNDYDYPISTTKEYKYILENNNITKYFIADKDSLFYRLNFMDDDNLKAVGSHLCGSDQYNATYIFLNSDSFTLNYQVLGPQKDYNINTAFNRV